MREHVIFTILGFAGVGIILTATSVYGPGLSPDSVAYIFAAKSLMSGEGYLMISGDPFVHWPPLFPTLLAGIDWIGIDPLKGIRVFNAAMYGLIVLATGHLLRTHIQSTVLVVIGTASLLISVIFLRVSIMAWSEPLFVFLAIIFVLYLSKFLTEKRVKILVLIGVFAGIACLQRYIGFTLIFTGIISIIFLTPSATRQQITRWAFLFGFISSIPLVIWLGRNYVLTSTISGIRPTSTTGLVENLAETLKSISTWVLPTNYLPPGAVQVLLVIVGVSVLTGLVGIAFRFILFRIPMLRPTTLGPAFIFVLIYILTLIVIRMRFDFYAPIGDRLLSPIYVFVLLFVLIGIERVIQALSTSLKTTSCFHWVGLIFGFLLIIAGILFNEWTMSRLLFSEEINDTWILDNLIHVDGSIRPGFRVIMLIFTIFSVLLGLVIISFRNRLWIGRLLMIGVFSLWLIYPITQSYVYVSTKAESGAGGFNTDGWRESYLIKQLQTEPLDGTVYTNVPDALFLLTRHSAISRPIRFPYQAFNNSDTAISEFSSELHSDENAKFLVWVDNKSLLDPAGDPNENLHNVSLMFQLEEIARFHDGGIYSFK